MTDECSNLLAMPVIGKAEDVARLLLKSRKRVQNMVTTKRFKQGIYIGDGRFNLSRLKDCIEKGSYVRE